MGKGPYSIGIVGCGVAGPAAAALLARDQGGGAGHRVTIFERAAPLRPVGAGLLLQPTGMHVLDKLGVLGPILQCGERVDRLTGITRSGRGVLDLAYADLEPGLFGLGISRGTLFETMLGAVRASGAQVREGVEIVRLVHDTHGRPALVDVGGATHGPFDLVLLCGGARSRLGSLLSKARPYPWGAVWALVPDPDRTFAGVLSQVYDSTTRMIGFLPTGEAEVNGYRGPTVSMFWSVRTGEIDALRAGGEAFAAWKREAAAMAARICGEHLVEAVDSPEMLTPAVYFDTKAAARLPSGVAMLGDAAHAMSPQLGQGANLALWDALVLAEELERGSDEGTAGIDAAVARYSARRRRHVNFYRRMSWLLTPIFQSDRRWISPLRDRLYGRMGKVPWVRRQMALSLAGVKTGALTRMALPERGGGGAGRPEPSICA